MDDLTLFIISEIERHTGRKWEDLTDEERAVELLDGAMRARARLDAEIEAIRARAGLRS